MKVTLITPPSVFLMDERVFMSLGILKVAAVLEKEKLEVDVIDLSGIANYEDMVSDYGRSNSSSIFGITATTPQLPAAMKVAKAIRKINPKAKIILGGPHITLVNAAQKREKAKNINGRATKAFQSLAQKFDTLVAGDGEESIFEALSPNAPQLIDADIPKTRLFLTNQQLEALPFPARHLVDVSSYRYRIDGVRALSVIAQLGCPFRCGFCGGRESPFLRRVRTRSSENVVAEMVYLFQTYGVRGFMMYDDELNVNRQMVELMNLTSKTQERLGVRWRLRGFIKSELFTEEQAEAMHRAGFRWILVGFESGSPRILRNMDKNATREDNTRCIEIARKHGLRVKALMSIGHPGESRQTIRETEEWLMEVKPDDFDATIITTYPGTPYYDYAVPCQDEKGVWVYTVDKNGDRLFALEVNYEEVADYYKGNPFNEGGYQSFVWTDHLNREELVRLRDELEKRVRTGLNIPFPHVSAARRYEHSMGQTAFPEFILRSSPAPHLRASEGPARF